MTQTTSPRYIGTAETAKYIREALKEAFPTIKFSVRSKSYSGGSSIRVEWTDGPTDDAVKSVTSRFEGASFDGMIDLKSYKDSWFNGEPVHFAADYVFTDRNTSVEFVTAVAKAYCTRYNHPMPMIAVTGNNVGYIADRDFSNYHAYQNDIFRKINETDAAELDKMFEQEDREIAEYEARKAERETQEAYADRLHNGVTLERYNATVESQNSEESLERRIAESEALTSLVVGYFDWCDRVCCSCVKECGLDVQGWSELTQAQSQADDGYLCDYCTKIF